MIDLIIFLGGWGLAAHLDRLWPISLACIIITLHYIGAPQ